MGNSLLAAGRVLRPPGRPPARPAARPASSPGAGPAVGAPAASVYGMRARPRTPSSSALASISAGSA
jgi:hypothetical protein